MNEFVLIYCYLPFFDWLFYRR